MCFAKKQNHYLDHNIYVLFFASLQKYFIPENVVAVILTIELKSVDGCKYMSKYILHININVNTCNFSCFYHHLDF